MPRKNEFISRIDQAVSAVVEEKRKSLGMTLDALGELSDVSYEQMRKYVSGENRITMGRMHAIADALGEPVSYFTQEALLDGWRTHKAKQTVRQAKDSLLDALAEEVKYG